MDEIKKESFRKKAEKLFNATEFRFIIFFLSLLVLSWPFLSFSNERPIYFPFVYFFSAWIGIIIIIMIINIFSGGENNKTII